MSFFERFFGDVTFSREETMVNCPFPHVTSSGLEYFESEPSAGVNLGKGVFHCLSCGKATSEIGFISQILDTPYETASKIKEFFDRDENVHLWKEHSPLTNELKELANRLGISDNVIDELNLGSEDGKRISFPVTMYDTILDTRSYHPDLKPKMLSRPNKDTAGLIIPYDVWIKSDKSRWTLLCAGEKDMAVARSQGFNAITLTGGEHKTPTLLSCFKGRKVAIVYDNDAAGEAGSKKVAAAIKDYASEVRVVTGFHEVCSEKGGDITDFFMKHGGTKQQLAHYIKNTPAFSNEEAEAVKEVETPTVTLMEATRPQNINRTLRSNIQVLAMSDASFTIPSSYYFEKYAKAGDDKHATMDVDEKRYWYLEERTAKDILHLIDNKFREEQVIGNMRMIANVPAKEASVKRRILSKEVVFKCTVADLFETSNDETVTLEYSAYVIGKKLESGKKYKVTHRIVPHPYDGQRLTMIILNVSEATDSVTNFKVSEHVKEHLRVVKDMEGSVEERIDVLVNKVRGLTKYETNADIIKTIDFAYNTVLEFHFRNFKNVRGYLDTLIVAESRVGKSSTAEALQKAYGLGIFTSLAGSSATVPGIIGGSNKTAGGAFQTRAGLIPQNHRGLIIFEELAKCNAQLIKELTDVRSSGRARIVRVGGSLDLPALVRMISLTNTRNTTGTAPRPITSYPNGIEILTDLIGSAEDIARYDLMLILSERGSSMDVNWEPPKTLPEEVYRTRVRWIWSRKPEQIIISHEVESFIIEKCNELNEKYNSHIKIFGTEAWKKVTRLACAVAGYLVSTDETYENIIIKQEHVEYAVNFLVNIYDNETFRLKEYVESERKFEIVDEEGTKLLQEIYITSSILLLQLEGSSVCTRPELMAATGLPQDQFNAQLNLLISGAFIRFQGQQIVPTLRFRKTMALIDRKVRISRLGGVVHDITKVG